MSQNNTERGANPMTAPPAGALEACLALLEKATPGPWKVLETEIPHYGKGRPHVARNIYTEWKHPQLQSEYPIVCQATGIGATKEGPAVQFTNIGSDNAAALVAAVSFLRTHGPALLAALRLREWIPVGERLPEHWEHVEVWPDPRDETYSFYAAADGGTNGVKAGRWYHNDRDGYDTEIRVTHWRPLPSPPEGAP